MKNLTNMVKNGKVFLSEIRETHKEKKITDYELYSLVAQISIKRPIVLLYKVLQEIEQHGLYNLCATIHKDEE